MPSPEMFAQERLLLTAYQGFCNVDGGACIG